MLPPANRLRRSADFRQCIRQGARTGTATLTVHLVLTDEAAPPRAGLVVSKAVGNAVVRNRVSRRLRHLVAPHLTDLPQGGLVVVRAQPAAATADSIVLGADLERGLRKATLKAAAKAPAGVRTAGPGAAS